MATPKPKSPKKVVIPKDTNGRVLWFRVEGWREWFKSVAPAHTNDELVRLVKEKYGYEMGKDQCDKQRKSLSVYMTGETRERAYTTRDERLFQEKLQGQSPESKTQPSDQVTYLRNEIRRLQSDMGRLHEESGFNKEVSEAIREEVRAIEPMPLFRYDPPKTQHADSEISAVLKLSDWHIGEVVREAETEGFGRFNWDIAQQRVGYIVKKFLDWISMHRTAFHIHKLHVICEGDFVSGDIHRELSVTNEFPVPVQAVRAGKLLAQGIAPMCSVFKEVHLIEVGGDNHGRMNPKPQFKQKAANNFLYVVYAMANEMLAKHTNLIIKGGEGMKYVADISGHRFLCEHGDTVKAWMGIPYYGLERERAREAHRRMQAKKVEIGFDYISCGHWHVPGIIAGNILVNGSLSGTSEFDHGCGRHAPPSQVSFLVHPKHGIFNWTTWRPE